LAASLASNLTAAAAVDEWIGKHPALCELDRAEIWFRPMMNTVALRLLGSVSWGLKFRVFTGAGMSMLDMISDINVIVLYLGSSDTEGYAMGLLWMLVSCALLQLLVVYFQNKGNKKNLLKEVLVVLTGLKPGKLKNWQLILAIVARGTGAKTLTNTCARCLYLLLVLRRGCISSG
jgi:hypothetical protein